MQTTKFNFTGLAGVYKQGCVSDGKTLAFELTSGKGHFLFMMFLSEEDGGDRDKLFLYLRNVNTILGVKTYGSHKNGDFIVYLTENQQNNLVQELQLNIGAGTFSFERFLNELNSRIPSTISVKEVRATLRNNRAHIPPHVVDDTEKTVLIGTSKLPPGKTPQDKTLRKLYLFAEGSDSEISSFISILKANNCTVRWTTEENRYRAAEINALISGLTS